MALLFRPAARATLHASVAGVVGACPPDRWAVLRGTRIGWDGLFALTGLFGVEMGADALALAGQAVVVRGFMSPPQDPAAGFFVLSRAPLPNCPFCNAGASWPDDIAVVRLDVPGPVELAHATQAIDVHGRLSCGWAEGPQPGLASWVRLDEALWRPADEQGDADA